MYVRGFANTTRRPDEPALQHVGVAPVLGEAATAGPRRQQLDDPEPDVVAGLGVVRTGVAEPDHQGGARRHGQSSDSEAAASAACSSSDGCLDHSGALGVDLGLDDRPRSGRPRR